MHSHVVRLTVTAVLFLGFSCSDPEPNVGGGDMGNGGSDAQSAADTSSSADAAGDAQGAQPDAQVDQGSSSDVGVDASVMPECDMNRLCETAGMMCVEGRCVYECIDGLTCRMAEPVCPAGEIAPISNGCYLTCEDATLCRAVNNPRRCDPVRHYALESGTPPQYQCFELPTECAGGQVCDLCALVCGDPQCTTSTWEDTDQAVVECG